MAYHLSSYHNYVRYKCDSHQALSVRPSLNTSSCKGNLNPTELKWHIISLDKNLKYPNNYVRYKCDSHQAISVRPSLNTSSFKGNLNPTDPIIMSDYKCDSHQAISVRPSLNTTSCKGNLNLNRVKMAQHLPE